ncbi:hypothetical protein GGR56DRAFT_697381 [Xylariaceae sp. FL0804]|nr:hypothetical protein GGR56DRAFT_697381 [Xylariaceae sp. FL0804]
MGHIDESPLGWAYIGVGAAWTVILTGGVIFLHRHRRLPSLQIRRLPLVFSAVLLLHIFALSCMFGPMIGPLVPCDAQFWVMSIYLPFGMALLQAANSHFQHVASQQRKYAELSNLEDRSFAEKPLPADKTLPLWRRALQRFRRADKTSKDLMYIYLAMVVNFFLTCFVYFGSEMFHPSYGFFHLKVPGTEQRKVLCFVGWEWWLSIVWQFFTSWIWAPYQLWRTRNIRDTHGWRLQATCCCIAGLPASPLWLAGLYIPQMATVNAYVLPPVWFAFSIYIIEIFMIFLPCWQVVKTHNLQQETREAIAAWEERNQSAKGGIRVGDGGDGGDFDAKTISTRAYSRMTLSSSGGAPSTMATTAGRRSTNSRGTLGSHKSGTLTMLALERALSSNPRPLLEFAALKDFSGENVSFLTHVADWRRAWARPGVSSPRDQFERGARIYAHFVSMDYSEFPVNVSSRVAKALHGVFAQAARCLHRPAGPVTPFGAATTTAGCSMGSLDGGSSSSGSSGELDLQATLGKANLEAVAQMADVTADDGQLDISVPPCFNERVFDDAESEIKYLVLTNTWPKFVSAGFESVSQASEERERTRILGGARKYLCGLDGDV